MEFGFLIIGLLAGAAIGWFAAKFNSQKNEPDEKDESEQLKSELNQAQTKLQLVEQQQQNLESELSESDKSLQLEREKVLELNVKLSTREADFRNLEEKLKDQDSDLQKLQERFTLQFKDLANQIFEEKTKKFTDQNKTNLSEVLNPLKERITDFEKKVDESNKQNIERNTALREQIRGLKELNLQITKEAENLTKALKGGSKTQGNWGEVILESILEKSGLVKNREYFLQESHTSEDGRRYQPDVLIRLPENKNIIVDSKVSLLDYERFFNAEDESEKLGFLKNHLQSVRRHVKDLGNKEYHQIPGLTNLDFVLLFIPIEPAFALAMQEDQNLFNEAFEKNIVIVSTSTLLATLRTIASIWRQEYQNQNAQEIARQGGELYDKFVGFVDDLISLGKHMRTSQKSYEEAMKKLSEGRGNLVGRAERIKKLGARAAKTLPQNLLNRAEDENND